MTERSRSTTSAPRVRALAASARFVLAPKGSARARWLDEASALAEPRPLLNVPFHVLMGEAVDVARFVTRYRSSAADPLTGAVRHGLETVGAQLSPSIADEILSLQQAAQEAHTAWLLLVDAPRDATVPDRARFVVAEIVAAVEWHLEDERDGGGERQLAQVAEAHRNDPDSLDALAGALEDYAALARPHRDALHGLGGFDAALIDEAATLAAALRDRPAGASRESAEGRAALAFRNRLVALLEARIRLVRRAARFVFRHHPEIAREATSAYERRRRAAHRRAVTPPEPDPAPEG